MKTQVIAALLFALLSPMNAQDWASLPLQRTLMGNLLRNATGCTGTPAIDRAHPESCPSAQVPARGQGQSHSDGRASGPPQPTPNTTLNPSAVSVRFQEDPAITAQVEQKAIDNLRQRSGDASAQALRQLLSRQNFRAQWSKMVSADGLERNDVIDIVAAEWVLDWVMVNRADNTRSQALGTRAQVAMAVARDPALLRLSNPERQQLGESLMLDQVVRAEAYISAKRMNRESVMANIGNNAQNEFYAIFGMDLRVYNLTDAGLRLKQR